MTVSCDSCYMKIQHIVVLVTAILLCGCASPIKSLGPLVKELKEDQASFTLDVVAAGVTIKLNRNMATNYIPTWYYPTNSTLRR